ncbi:MAG TPA: Gfo/Idh/MocA family oxidoreductase, partial [Bacteroidota bacterium]|nr:Gfo/Idh/MocA family oxidoreductase [Bacteroidota bacterium]
RVKKNHGDTMERLNVGVIGVGHLGSLHAKMYAQIPTAEFVGVYDVDAARAAAIATEYKVRAFGTIHELLANVQAVSIATVTQEHFDVAMQVLQNGIHVLVEKPLTATIEQGRRLVEEADKRNLKLQVGHIERFNPAILALEPYKLKPLFIESHRLAQFNPRGSDVAVVLDLMIHDIDLILALVQSKVSRIDANGVAVISDTVDIANARLQFENGCVANVTASRISQNKMRKMRLFQSDAYISIDFAQGLSEVFHLVDEENGHAKQTMLLGKIDQGKKKRLIVYEQPEVLEVNALNYELEQFVEAVQTNTKPIVDGHRGLHALEVADEILRIIESQKIQVG